MTSTDGELEERLQRLRAAFDGAFALPLSPPRAPGVPLLLVRAGASALAVRLDELSGVEVAPPLTRLPVSRRGLLGLAVVRGRLVAVFDLAALVDGGARALDPPPPTHLALPRGSADVALGLTRIEGRAEADPAALPAGADEVVTTLSIDGAPRGLLSVGAVLDLIRAGAGGDA